MIVMDKWTYGQCCVYYSILNDLDDVFVNIKASLSMQEQTSLQRFVYGNGMCIVQQGKLGSPTDEERVI